MIEGSSSWKPLETCLRVFIKFGREWWCKKGTNQKHQNKKPPRRNILKIKWGMEYRTLKFPEVPLYGPAVNSNQRFWEIVK